MKIFWKVVDYAFVIDGNEDEKRQGHRDLGIALIGVVLFPGGFIFLVLR